MALRSVVIISDPTVFPPVSPLPPVPSPSFPFECSDPHDAVPAILVFRSRGITLKTHELSINNVIVSGALRSAAGTNDWASNWVLVPKKTLQNSHNILRIHNGSPAFSSSAESFRLDDVVILYESTGRSRPMLPTRSRRRSSRRLRAPICLPPSGSSGRRTIPPSTSGGWRWSPRILNRSKIGVLRDLWQNAEKLHRTASRAEYEELASHIYGRLREAWERGLEEVLLNRVIERLRIGIETQRARALLDITADDYEALDRGITKCSRWMAGHDQAAAENAPLPGPQELKSDIDALDEWVAAIWQRRRKAQ